MTMHTQTLQPDADNDTAVPPLAEEQARRAALYSLLAALLRAPPTDDVLGYVRSLESTDRDDDAELTLALGSLALAARHTSSEALRDEYHALFIGLGRGELVPYGSWYQTGFLMEKPLGLLREDLRRLGFERDQSVHEPEDHVAALCEVLAMLIHDQTPLEQQVHFFQNHLGNWAPDLFADLEEARSAVLYRSVGRLGRAFLSLESRYLSFGD